MSARLDITLPKTWVWSSLKFSTSFLNRGAAPDYVEDGPVRVISQAANQALGLDWDRTRFHDYQGNPRRLKGYLIPGDVLVNSTGTGTLGRVGYFTAGPDNLPCVADGHITVVRADRRVADSKFIYYWLSSRLFYDFIHSALTVGATNQIELNRERLAGAPVAIPPLDEQRRIADFLDGETAQIDRLTSLRLLQLAQVDEREKAWRTELFRGSRSGIWTRVKYLLRTKARYGVLVPEFVDEGVPFIRVSNLIGLSSRDGLAVIPKELSRQYSRTVTMLDDVLLSVVGTLGRAAVVSEELVGANTARAVAVLRLYPRYASALFAAWVGTAEFERQALLATGADSAQPTLGMEDLSNFSVRWPEDETEQKYMAEAASERQLDAAELTAVLNRQLALLAERRQALIVAAVTGQIDVWTTRGAELSGGVVV
ncbi:restriction endonuclease subunit S [Amycolatopsis sp. NPDC089917]|uniref:restriction endonuclease subunit S n=1 Tax=Amycolatopsis sp. NPDC089917 TaxID=3155187 RepID=UPI00341CBF9B